MGQKKDKKTICLFTWVEYPTENYRENQKNNHVEDLI